jgi:predicted transcriptional regulator
MASDRQASQYAADSLRDPAELMRPERLAALKQTRLSFVRMLIRKMQREQWEIDIDRADLDAAGEGRIVYHIDTPTQLLSFGVFSHSTAGENTDRIIADNWDMWGFLCEGRAPPAVMDAQYEELPEVREGRATADTLIWTRANRSSRFFGHVVDALAAGHQPDIEFLAQGGYLMRSSGYYGNGLNGTKQFEALSGDHPLKRPYMAQMLSVYLLRAFGYDLAERMAAARSSDAVRLDREIKRYLGTGNSSGIGIIHYVINHPQLLNAWLRAREVALARVKTVTPSAADRDRFRTILGAARRWFAEDQSETKEFFLSKDRIAGELGRVETRVGQLTAASDGGTRPADGPVDEGDVDGSTTGPEGTAAPLWGRLCAWADRTLAMETQEVLHSLLLDVHPDVCAGLAESLTVSERSDLDPGMRLGTLQSVLEADYEWVWEFHRKRPGARRYFWYRSIDSEEPRLGVREEHDYEEYGLPIDVAHQVQRLAEDLNSRDPTETVAEFLFEFPEHRSIVERVQTVHALPYAEIRANPLDEDFVPLSFISCLKAIWGIQKAHPKSKGWVRGTFCQGAPLRDELAEGGATYWLYPSKPERAPRWVTEGD